MDYCHTQSSEKFTQKRVIVELPIKLVLITFNDFFLNFFFFLILSHQLEWLRPTQQLTPYVLHQNAYARTERPTNPTYYQTLMRIQRLLPPPALSGTYSWCHVAVNGTDAAVNCVSFSC